MLEKWYLICVIQNVAHERIIIILANKIFSGYQTCKLLKGEKTNVSKATSVLVLRVLILLAVKLGDISV